MHDPTRDAGAPEVPRVPPDSTHWLVRPDTIRKLWIGTVVILVLTVVPDFFVEPHPYFGFDGLPAFSAVYGFGACVAMVLLSKALGFVLKRKDTYYDG
jgi:hypothetical protein